jgi:hypothetical protein
MRISAIVAACTYDATPESNPVVAMALLLRKLPLALFCAAKKSRSGNPRGFGLL